MAGAGNHAIHTPIETAQRPAFGNGRNGGQQLRVVEYQLQHARSNASREARLGSNASVSPLYELPLFDASDDGIQKYWFEEAGQSDEVLAAEVLAQLFERAVHRKSCCGSEQRRRGRHIHGAGTVRTGFVLEESMLNGGREEVLNLRFVAPGFEGTIVNGTPERCARLVQPE
jgi:hypothetical protein